MSRRRATRAVIASGLASTAGVQPGVPASRRFSAPGRSAGLWIALWSLAVAAEFLALVPIIFAGDAPVAGGRRVPPSDHVGYWSLNAGANA